MTSKMKKMLILELGIILLVLIIFTIVKYNLVTILPQCLFNKFLGIKCPSCGGTRWAINFVLGNWKESFSYHPIFFITIVYLMGVNLVYIINSFRQKEILTWLYPKSKFWIIWIIILIIFTIIRNII